MNLILQDSFQECDDGVHKHYYEQSDGFMGTVDEFL